VVALPAARDYDARPAAPTSIRRFTRGGWIDRTFDCDGVARTRVLESGLAVERSGRVVVGGQVGEYPSYPRAALARLNPDGTVDRSFGGDGKVVANRFGEAAFTSLALGRGGTLIATLRGLYDDKTFRLAGFEGGGAPPAPDHEGPSVAISHAPLHVTRAGRVSVRLRYPASEQESCRGRIELRTVRWIGGNGRVRVLGRASFHIAAGETASVPVRLGRRARLAAPAGRLRIVVTARDPGGNARVSSAVVELG
jgi:hypothetical protein